MPYYEVFLTEPSQGCTVFAHSAGKAKSEALYSHYDDCGVEYTRLRARKVPAPAIDFSYINKYYGLSIKTGTLCRFEGKAEEVVGTSGPHLKVYIKEGYYKGRVVIYHPTSEMEYDR